jgi:hypothetical protein
MSNREKCIALFEAAEIGASDKFFAARSVLDCNSSRSIYMRAFQEAWYQQAKEIDLLNESNAQLSEQNETVGADCAKHEKEVGDARALLREAAGHLRGFKMSVLARSREQLIAKIEEFANK